MIEIPQQKSKSVIMLYGDTDAWRIYKDISDFPESDIKQLYFTSLYFTAYLPWLNPAEDYCGFVEGV